MVKGYILSLLIICLLSLLAQQKYLVNAQETVDVDDMDSFFETEDDDSEIFDEPMDEEQLPEDEEEDEPKPKMKEEKVEIPAPQYEPEEPTPVFESETEKYMYYGRKYLVEICLGSIFFVYILNIFVGKKVNTKIVSMWLAEAVPVLQKNFHHLGFGDESNLALSQLKYHEFEFYASGRDN